MAGRRISLCMIVKNESQLLAGCLASAKPWVDEMVVVDTGSEDDTVAIAERAGARVSRFAWCDDFAEARNRSVAEARGDWVLYLDADERLAPGAGAAVRRAVKRGVTLGVLRLHNAATKEAAVAQVLSGAARIGQPRLVLRLFERRRERPFRGCIHEDLLDWIREDGLKPTTVDADIVHLGYTPEMWGDRAKAERNLALLARRVEAEPDNADMFGHLAAQRMLVNDVAGAWDAAERGWAALVRGRAGRPPLPSPARVAGARAGLFLGAGKPAEALETIAQARAWDRDGALYAYLAGMASEALGRFDDAAREYRACVTAGPGEPTLLDVEGMTTWLGRLRLGTALLALGRPREAATELLAATDGAPASAQREMRLALAESALECGDLGTAVSLLEGTLGEAPDGWILAAAVARAAGSTADVRALLEKAGAGRTPLIARHRRARWDSLRAEAGL